VTRIIAISTLLLACIFANQSQAEDITNKMPSIQHGQMTNGPPPPPPTSYPNVSGGNTEEGARLHVTPNTSLGGTIVPGGATGNVKTTIGH
jgi:hypothetical protein